MATKNLSIELGRGKSKVICIAMHPGDYKKKYSFLQLLNNDVLVYLEGTVDTDLSRPYHKGVPADKLFTTEKSVTFLMAIIDRLSVEETGKCIGWDGNIIPY